VRAVYEANNFVVIRSAGSKGAADLIAWDEEVCHLIQCKKESKKKSYKDDGEKLRGVKTPKFQKWIKVLWVKSNKKIIVRFLGETSSEDVDDTTMTIKDINKRLKGVKSGD
jgi:Holliday junction resolvase